MIVYVTGASGFVGGHVVRELRAAGHDVRDEWIDLLDRERLRSAIRGCDAVFHVAALYSYDAPATELERVNVEGTRVVVELCREERVGRLVHTSTAGTCGPVAAARRPRTTSPPPGSCASRTSERSSRRSGSRSPPARSSSTRRRPWATATASPRRRAG